jgi:hypothetical protein
MRPSLTVHQQHLHRRAQTRKDGDQHEWTPGIGEHLREAFVAQREVQGRVFEGLRQHGRADYGTGHRLNLPAECLNTFMQRGSKQKND